MEQDRSGATPVRVAPWVRLLDVVTLLVAALLLWDVLTARTRTGIFFYLPFVKVPFLIYALATLLFVRHVAAPRPSILARVRHGWRRIGDRPDWGPAVRIFLGTRFMVFVAAYFAVASIGFPRPTNPFLPQPLSDLPARWDAGWYGDVALFGYDREVDFSREKNIAFFPAMPLLMRAVGPIFGASATGVTPKYRMGRVIWAGVFVSLTAFLFALYYLVRFGADLFGWERGAGAALLLACYPFAYFFNAPYTEAVFLLAIVATGFHFHRRQFAIAAVWGLLAGLTRPNGFLLSVPLGVIALTEYVRQRRSKERSGDRRPFVQLARGLAAAAAPTIGMLAFTAYLQTVTGVWFAWSRSHEAWGRTFKGFLPLTRGFERLQWDGIVGVAFDHPYDTLNSLAAAFALIMVWPVARRVGVPWAIFVLAVMVPPILAGGALSLGRMTSTLFPVFLALAAILPLRAIPVWATGFAILQGLGAALFFTWRALY